MNTIEKDNYVYYYKDGFTVPAKVLKINLKTFTIEANFNEGTRVVNVKKDNCQLQTEWLEEVAPELAVGKSHGHSIES